MRLHVHLISDSTGETVTTVARAAVSQFEDVVPVDPANLATEFIEWLRPQTIIGNIPGLTMVPFNIRVLGQTSDRHPRAPSSPTTGSSWSSRTPASRARCPRPRARRRTSRPS